ncbi:MAG: hypothetical protein MUP30_09050 [Deltaproteobacteria bacterium]|nr:hypothetical protein [Deltaproteobacteria bacterium]
MNIFYWALFIIMFTFWWLVTFVSFFVIINVIEKKSGHPLISKRKAPPVILIISLIIIPIVTSSPATYYSLGYFKFYPKQLSSDISVDKVNKDLVKLQKNKEQLEKLLKSPESLTMSQIREIMNETLKFTYNLNEKSTQQQKLINHLREDLTKEKKRTEETLILTKQVQSVTKKQLDAVKFLITEDARTQSRNYFLYGLVCSFIITSVLTVAGTILYIRSAGRIADKISQLTVPLIKK